MAWKARVVFSQQRCWGHKVGKGSTSTQLWSRSQQWGPAYSWGPLQPSLQTAHRCVPLPSQIRLYQPASLQPNILPFSGTCPLAAHNHLWGNRIPLPCLGSGTARGPAGHGLAHSQLQGDRVMAPGATVRFGCDTLIPEPWEVDWRSTVCCVNGTEMYRGWALQEESEWEGHWGSWGDRGITKRQFNVACV